MEGVAATWFETGDTNPDCKADPAHLPYSNSTINSLLFPCSSSEQLHEFAFSPFLFPAHLAALAHSLNSLLAGSCSPAHDYR
jgi:hypothetical protein